MFTGLVGSAIHNHIFEMIPDIRFLYDNDRVEESVYGGYVNMVVFELERAAKTENTGY